MIQALPCDILVPIRLALVTQGAFDIVKMIVHSRPGGLRLAILQGRVDGTVLVQKRLPRGALPEHDLTIVKHAVSQQLVHRTHHVQHDHIVAGLDDRHVELRIELRLFFGVAPGMGRRHLFEDHVDDREIGVRGQPRGPLRRQTLHVTSKAQVVEHGLFVTGKKVRQCRRKGRAEDVRNKDTGPGTRTQKARVLQMPDRLAQRRTGHAQPLRQFAFRRQPLARTQHAPEDQLFYLLNDCGGQFFGVDRAKGHEHASSVNWSKHMTSGGHTQWHTPMGMPRVNALFTLTCHVTGMTRAISLCLFFLIGACNTAGPHFRGLPATTLTIEGSTFDVRVRGDLAEAIRTNPEYAPRFGPIRDRARRAMELVSGCDVKEVRGDQAQATGILDCGAGGPSVDRLKPQGEYACRTIDRYISPAPQEVVLALDCDLI